MAVPHTSVMTNAGDWLTGLVTGSLATTIATLAIAGLGFALLTGRMNIRIGARAILGVFVLFGAPVIAAGLMSITPTSSPGIARQIVDLPYEPTERERNPEQFFDRPQTICWTCPPEQADNSQSVQAHSESIR